MLSFKMERSIIISSKYWPEFNYHVYNLTHTHYNERVNVWVGIICNTFIGSFFIDNTLNTNTFLELFRIRIKYEI